MKSSITTYILLCTYVTLVPCSCRTHTSFYFQPLHKVLFMPLHILATYCSHYQGASITET
jgi:hypothetical protein